MKFSESVLYMAIYISVIYSDNYAKFIYHLKTYIPQKLVV